MYSPNEKIALNTFTKACNMYATTNNMEFKNYWEQLKSNVENGNYLLTHNTDFCGIRSIV